MVIMTPITINGSDISDVIAFRGVSWSYRYVNGKNGGVTLDGTTRLDVLATKCNLSIKCVPLTFARLQEILALIAAPEVEVTYDDPVSGTTTKTMHPSGQKADFLNEDILGADARMMWDGFSFKLEEL